MSLTLARLIIWNPDSYSRARIRQAAVFLLGSFGTRSEDIGQATLLLATGGC